MGNHGILNQSTTNKGNKKMIYKKITVALEKNYGNEAIYPLCADAEIFASIAGTKTLTRATCKAYL